MLLDGLRLMSSVPGSCRATWLVRVKSEQDRIGRALAQADERVGKMSASFDQIEEVITRAIAWWIPCTRPTRQPLSKSGGS